MSLIREDASSVGKQMLINDRYEQVRGLVVQEHYNRINTSRKRSHESLTMLEIEKSKKKSNKALPSDQQDADQNVMDQSDNDLSNHDDDDKR